MRKSFVLLLTLIVFVSGTAYYAQGELLKEKDQVRFEETVLYGDRSVVEGVTVEANLSYNYKLFWKTLYEIGGESEEKTEYQFFPWSKHDTDNSYSGSMSFMVDGRDVMISEYVKEREYEGLQIAMKELVDDTPAGTQNSTTVYLKDYVEDYNFMVEFTMPHKAGEDDSSYMNHSHFYFSETELRKEIADLEKSGRDSKELEELKAYLADVDAFQAFFKIPVLDTEVYTLAVAKDESGQIIGIAESSNNSGSATGEIDIPNSVNIEGADSFDFNIYSAFDNGDCYFTFEPHTDMGNVVDVSQIPGGYGIYHFNYDQKQGTIDASNLKLVYPLDIEKYVTEIRIDGTGKNILMFTYDEVSHYMSIIDRETLTLMDTFTLGDIESYISTWTYEDYMAIATDQLMVFELGEDGRYVQAFSVDKELLEEIIVTNSDFLSWGSTFDWNGETLLIADRLIYYSDKEDFSGEYTCDFYLTAVDENGLLYYGEYACSLSTIDGNISRCMFNSDMEFPLTVQWKEK